MVWRCFVLSLLFFVSSRSPAQDNRTFKIFQFPSNMIPVIDGKTDDWQIVNSTYNVGLDQLWDDRDDSIRHRRADPKNLDVNVKVGWVKGLNRLYFLYEADDDYWDFSSETLHNDIFELVVDGDQSGGPFIASLHPNKQIDQMEAYFSFHGVHAQNYHIFTPAKGKAWAMVWGNQHWIRELPYANHAYNYQFNPGEPGHLTLEFWITPFDYAAAEDRSRLVESVLKEGNNIGLSWAVLDYDNITDKHYNGFWNLSRERTMYGNASFLLPFRLMPLEKQFVKAIQADWSFVVTDMQRRMVSFKDQSTGIIDEWEWDFGDGQQSTEKNPIHFYTAPGHYVVTLRVKGRAGTSKMSKVWDVTLR